MPLTPVATRRLKIAAFSAATLILVFAVAARFGIPAAVRWALAGPVSQELGRPLSVAAVRVNPFTLKLELDGLELAPGPGETRPLATVRSLTVNASWTSLLHRAPVLDHVVVSGLQANLVRTGPQRFNFSDIVERVLAKPASPEPTRFAVYNIEVADSAIRLDDQVRQAVEEVSEISLGIPFISNFPSDRKIQVQPRLAARVNGQAFVLAGDTLPFEQSLDTVLKIKFDQFDLPHLLSFSPVALNFELGRGKLGADLSLTFRRATPAQGDQPAQAERLILAGTAQVDDFALSAPAGRGAQPLASFKRLTVKLDELGLLARQAKLGAIELESPSIELVRHARGTNWADFAARPLLEQPRSTAANKTSAPPSAAAAPWSWSLARLAVADGRVHFVDETAGRFEHQAEAIQVDLTGLASESASPAKFSASLSTPQQERLNLDGTVGLAPLAGQVRFDAQDTQLRTAARYLAHVLDAHLEGRSQARGTLEFAQNGGSLSLAIQDLQLAGQGIRVSGPATSGAQLDIATLKIDGGRIDLAQRSIDFGKVAIEAPRATVTRLADGSLGWMQLLRPNSAPAAAEAPWKIRVGEAELSRGDLRFEDRSTQPAAQVRVASLQVQAKNLAPGTPERSDLALRAVLGKGSLAANGWISLDPIASRLAINARNLNLASLRPYLGQYLNAVVASAEASARGQIELALPAGTPPRFAYQGNARLSNLLVLEPSGESELLRWQSLSLDKIRLQSGAPLKLAIGEVALSDFYARAILSAAGKLNLADVLKRPAPAAPPESAPAAAPEPESPRPQIQVGGIKLTRGNINFTDNFIQPNYTANVTGLSGTISALSSDDAAVPADVDLNGKIDDQAPVTVAGTLNPLARELTLDLRGAAEGIDLPSFTPYSAKYAGYPITKGKLSLQVNYKIAQGQLSADNKIELDQLTFGERVDSPDATKLPVLLAVSLLKDREGNIDINLPISGSLSDPQFSVGGLIFRAVVNLLVKAVTSPFSLLASSFGGGGEELGFVSFAAGSSLVGETQQNKLDTLARALLDRPGLKLDIIGRVDPALDIPGIKTAKLEAKLRALRVKELVRAGNSVDPATITLSAAERPALIAEVYGEESIPDKPRNFIGLAKSIPTAEQERLILANIKVTPEDLRTLASQRAFAARAYLEAKGQVPRDRLFIVEPKLNAEGIKDGSPTPRVDFELK